MGIRKHEPGSDAGTDDARDAAQRSEAHENETDHLHPWMDDLFVYMVRVVGQSDPLLGLAPVQETEDKKQYGYRGQKQQPGAIKTSNSLVPMRWSRLSLLLPSRPSP